MVFGELINNFSLPEDPDPCPKPATTTKATTAAPATTKAPATTAAPATTKAPATTAAPATTKAPATTAASAATTECKYDRPKHLRDRLILKRGPYPSSFHKSY